MKILKLLIVLALWSSCALPAHAEQARPREYQARPDSEKVVDAVSAFKWLGRKIKSGLKKVVPSQGEDETAAPPPAQQTGPTSMQANLTGVVTSASVEQNTLRFSLSVRNTGATALRTTLDQLRIKPLLVPRTAGKDGIVADWKDYAIELESQASTTLEYSMPLPNVPRDDYALAVVINSNAKFPESSQLDNVTDLFALGAVESTNETPIAQNTESGDLVTTPAETMEVRNGVISHNLYTIAYGRQQAPLLQGGGASARLWARFMMADFSTGKVYTVPYRVFSQNAPEKQWYALVWPADRVGTGYRYIDSYNQRTFVDGIPPGNYKYMTLINSHDEAQEANTANNLDVRELTLSSARADSPEVWVVAPNRAVPSTSVTFKTDFSRGGSTAPSLSGDAASWMSLTPIQQQSVYGFGTFQLDAGSQGASEGAYEAHVKIPTTLTNTQYYGVPESFEAAIKVRTFVQGSGAPSIEISQSVVDVRAKYEDIQGGTASSKTFTVRNTGNATLEFLAYVSRDQAIPTWLKISPASASVEPGQSVEVKLQFDPEPFKLGYTSMTEIKFLTNVPRTNPLVDPRAQPSVRVTMQVLRPYY